MGQRVQKLDRIAFESETAESYHSIKHQAELPPLENRTGNGVQDYAAAAKDTIQTGTVVDAKRMPNGSTRIVIRKAYPGEDIPQILEAIIYIAPQGRTVLATYGRVKAKT
jgi:hypothetical protein